MPEKGRIMEKLKGSVSRENTGEFFLEINFPLGLQKLPPRRNGAKARSSET